MLHILLIEDDALVALDLANTIKRQGYRVSHAINGQEGVETFDSDPADLVITDLNMPVMDGYTVICTLKEKSPETPIVVLAGVDRAKTEDKLRALGVETMLTKPANRTELIAAVRQALGAADLGTAPTALISRD